MIVALYGRVVADNLQPHIRRMISELQIAGAQVIIYEPFLNQLPFSSDLPDSIKKFSDYEELKDKADFMFSVGGDGTFLEATTFVRNSGIPILGINIGRLGFLSSISIQETQAAIDAIVKKNYLTDSRSLLKLHSRNSLFGKKNFALNELTVHKKDTSSMITIHTWLDGSFLNSYWADGLIISTPTGSTAYSLSCGGPIVLPRAGNFLITPIAPHNLNVRPVVVSNTCEIKLKVEGRSNGESFLVSLDSRSETIDSSVELTVSRNDFEINILRLPDYSYLNTIRNKLNWGVDKRN